MATAGEVFRRSFSQELGISNGGSSDQELHVLAVDDSLVDRKVIERLLKISSCKVTAVESGTRALQYLGLDGGEKSSVGFNDLKVNLIMTDYSMPGMTGYELLKKIKESSAFREIPVVIMSSENILTRIDRCLEEGAEEFLVKPVKLSDVRRLKDFIIAAGEHKREENILKRKVEEEEEEDSMFESSSESSDSSSSSSSSSSSDLPYSTFVSSATAVNMSKRAKLQSRDSFC